VLQTIWAIVVVVSLFYMTAEAFAQTQKDIESDACASYRQSDEELNTVYKTILAEYKNDKAFLAKLKKTQKAWLAYRDAHAASVYPAQDKQAEYGSMYATCYCTVQQELTTQRTEMLKQWIRGVEEGNVCAGSRKVAQ